MQRAQACPAGAAPPRTIQRTFDEARAAAYVALHGSGASANVAGRRATFDATYPSWDALKTLEHRVPPREWSRIRYLNDKGTPSASVPAPPPAPPARAPARGPAPPSGRRAPSAEESAQVRRRGQIGHVMRDVDRLVYDFQAEIELQKRFRPSEILANQMTLVAGGVAKILLGAIQLGTAGLSAPITGALIGAVDLGTSGARAGLGYGEESGGEAQAGSATKSLMITSATRAIGPVAPFTLGPGYHAASAVPVLGGAAAIALGAKDVWDGLQGIQLSAGDIAFMRESLVEIRSMQARITAKAAEMARFPELATAAARWRACATALGVVAADLSKLLAKKPRSSSPKTETVDAWSAPMTRGRSSAVHGPPGAPPPPEPLVMLP
ncbi:MAG: hypothetical protein QOJ35_3730 [Solirubrobacteraceae bacterium]|nr:hypothetical protein [Solirubrobacteraceae bacterium]